MTPVPRPALVAGVARRAELVAARRAAGEAHVEHQRACPACQTNPWGSCAMRDLLRAEWEDAIDAEDAARPGAPR